MYEMIIHCGKLSGMTCDDVEVWLHKNNSEENLALAIAEVCNQVGSVMHEVSEDDGFILEQLDKWFEFEKKLCDKISKEYPALFDCEKAGYHNQIRPFMIANGYRDGSGWWIKN